jgi:hypothetical protein|tara:strand:- start:992 stop:1231 length:240 start_codon:yes stop_codon:yes gene_type:complete
MAQPIATLDCEFDNLSADFRNFLKSIKLVFDISRTQWIQYTKAQLSVGGDTWRPSFNTLFATAHDGAQQEDGATVTRAE